MSAPHSERRAFHPRHRIPGARVGSFAASALPAVPDFAHFIASVEGYDGLDQRFVHAADVTIQRRGGGLVRNENMFGEQGTRAAALYETGNYRMRSVESVLLHDVIFSPQSMTISTASRGFYDVSLANYFLAPPKLSHMVSMDHLYQLDAAEEPIYAPRVAAVERSDAVAMPVCGTGFPNYGHFLYDGLPLVHQVMSVLRGPRPVIVGPPLRPWQRAILEALDLAGSYRPLQSPVLFRKLVTSSLISLHVPYPTRFIRPMLDTLRFRLGAAATAPGRRVFISRASHDAKRSLTNRAAVEECFARHRFEIVRPEELSFVQQVRLFSTCAVVAGESGAGLGNIAFCDPGTRVLEIQPALFTEGWTRSACMQLGFDWFVLFAKSETSTAQAADQPHTSTALSFEVDMAELERAIARVQA